MANLLGKPKHVEDVTASAPDRQKWEKPWTMIGFFAGRTGSNSMRDNSNKVFQAAFKMMDDVAAIAKNSGDRKLLERIEEIQKKWNEMAREGVEKLGVKELELCLSGGAAIPGSGTPYRQISRGIKNSDVNLTVNGLQEIIDPYAKEIYGKSDEYNALEAIGEQANQFQNKSEAIMKAPLWRRGLERIWQSFSVIGGPAPKNTNQQLEELRSAIDRIYRAETSGTGEIGNWYREYAQKSYVGSVLARARESGTVAGIEGMISHAIKNPREYSSYAWKETAMSHIRSRAEELQIKLDSVKNSSDPAIREINYESINLTKSINSMRGRLNQTELVDVLEEWNRNFERNGKRLGMHFREVRGIGVHDFVPGTPDKDQLKAEEAWRNLRDYFLDEYAHGIRLFTDAFSSPAEIREFFDKQREEFNRGFRTKKELLENLMRDMPRETPFGEVNAPVLE